MVLFCCGRKAEPVRIGLVKKRRKKKKTSVFNNKRCAFGPNKCTHTETDEFQLFGTVWGEKKLGKKKKE